MVRETELTRIADTARKGVYSDFIPAKETDTSVEPALNLAFFPESGRVEIEYEMETEVGKEIARKRWDSVRQVLIENFEEGYISNVFRKKEIIAEFVAQEIPFKVVLKEDMTVLVTPAEMY